MYQCGLYTRVSTQMQADVANGSLVTQRSRLEEFIKYKNLSTDEEWDVYKVFEDGGISGKDIDRPALQDMIREIKLGKLNVVVVTKIDRISRSVVDFSHLWKLFEKHNVQFISLAENFDSSTAIGRAMLKLTLVFAELERETIGERTRGKSLWRAKQGLWNGNTVLGYDIHPEMKGYLVINETESELVRLIFNTYLRVKSVKETAKELNEKGYRTKAHKSKKGTFKEAKKFLGSSISKILQNPVYIGKIRFKGELYDGKQDSIIDIGTWEAVQKRFASVYKERPKRKKRMTHPFFLAGVLKCGNCGSFMTPYYAYGKYKKRYYYYECTRRNHNGKGKEEQGTCDMMYVPAEEIENLMINEVKRLSLDKKIVEEAVERASTSSAGKIEKLKQHKKKLESSIREAEKRRDNYSNMIGNGVFFDLGDDEKEVMLAGMKKAIQDKKEIESSVRQVEFQIADEESRVFNAAIMSQTVEKFSELYERADNKQKKELVKLIFHRIEFTPDVVRYSLYEAPENEKLLQSELGEEFRCNVVYDSP